MGAASIADYLGRIKRCLDEAGEDRVLAIIDSITAAYRRGATVFLLGNGGSAASASHFACDLHKIVPLAGRPRLRAVSLTDNVPVMTAIANDLDYASVFREQLAMLLNPDDVVVCISASGNSANVVEAAAFARERGAEVLALLGFGGGELAAHVDRAVVLASRDYGQVEGVHVVLAHLITTEVGRRIRGED